MLSRYKKKKRPIDIFSNIRKPHLEEAYVKFPAKNLRRTSKERGEDSINLDWDLLYKLKKKYGSKYTVIHTHPSGSGTPSLEDLATFLVYDEIKTSVIVPLKRGANQPQGYFVMKKNKDFKHPKADKEAFLDSLNNYHQNLLSSGSLQEDASNLKKIADKYNFSYRFFPAEGIYLREKTQGFRSSRQPLEAKLIVISFIFISLSILVNLYSITGSVISYTLRNSSNTLSIGLFIATLCLAGSVFFVRRISKSHSFVA